MMSTTKGGEGGVVFGFVRRKKTIGIHFIIFFIAKLRKNVPHHHTHPYHPRSVGLDIRNYVPGPYKNKLKDVSRPSSGVGIR